MRNVRMTIYAAMVLFSMSYARAGAWITLDMPGAGGTYITGIDGSNIVGYYVASGKYHGFLYNGASWTTLDYPGATDTQITGISGSNIVGHCNYALSGDGGGVIFNGTSWTTFKMENSNSTFIFDIDGSNIVGSYGDNFGWHGFLHDGISGITLDVEGVLETHIRGIDKSNMVGSSYLNNYHGFFYDGTNWTTLDMPGASNTHITGISGSYIVGHYNKGPLDYTPHGFLYDGTSWITIDMPEGLHTRIYGIEGNKIFGYYQDATGDHGFVYTIPESATLLLLDPNGGEELVAGATYHITWETEGSIENVLIEYSTDDGQSWNEVNTVPNNGSYEWTVPDVTSANCLVRISDASYPSWYDTSDDMFTIYVCTLAYDLNHDCLVNLSDFAFLVSEWLQCGNPFDSNCIP